MELMNLSKTKVFIYCDGKFVSGNIDSEFINDELIEAIQTTVEPLNEKEQHDFFNEIKDKIT